MVMVCFNTPTLTLLDAKTTYKELITVVAVLFFETRMLTIVGFRIGIDKDQFPLDRSGEGKITTGGAFMSPLA